jgi:hypothetical protein
MRPLVLIPVLLLLGSSLLILSRRQRSPISFLAGVMVSDLAAIVAIFLMVLLGALLPR